MLTSDYSRATGVWMSTSSDYYGDGYWWLRSPYGYSSNDVRFVSYDGSIFYTDVVPALQIQL